MPKVSEQHAVARRQQIIDAAYRCFAAKGFHQTSMRDIYEEAGLSPGAVYHYFDGKHEIIAASFDFDYQRSLEMFDAARESEDPLHALVDLLAFLFTGLKSAAALGAGRVNVQGWGEALINPDLHREIRRVLDVYRDKTTDILHRAQELRQIDQGVDASALSTALISLYYGLELQLALDPAIDVVLYSDTVTAVLKKALQAS